MSFKAGTGISEISPPKGMELGGYPHYPRHNTGVHDPLYAACMVFDDGEQKAALVTLDLLFFSKKHVFAVRKEIEAKTGIPYHNIMVSCSHTHSGPWASGRLDIESLLAGVQQDEHYVAFLKQRIIDMVCAAAADMFEADMGMGEAVCGKEQGVGGNRCDRSGPVDDTLRVLSVKDKQGKVRGISFSYAVHPTVLDAENTQVSADYPGYIREYLRDAAPGAVMLFAVGTAGNQSTRYFRNGQTFEEAKRIGYELGKAVVRALESSVYTDTASIKTCYKEISLILRELQTEDELGKKVEQAKTTYDSLVAINAPYIEKQNANLKLLGAEDILGYAKMINAGRKMELVEDEQPPEVQVMRIGDFYIAGLPGEVFVEYGLEIKKRSPFVKTNVFTCTNGCLPGYVYTKEALVQGGYETDTSLLAPGFGELLAETAVDLLKKV